MNFLGYFLYTYWSAQLYRCLRLRHQGTTIIAFYKFKKTLKNFLFRAALLKNKKNKCIFYTQKIP